MGITKALLCSLVVLVILQGTYCRPQRRRIRRQTTDPEYEPRGCNATRPCVNDCPTPASPSGDVSLGTCMTYDGPGAPSGTYCLRQTCSSVGAACDQNPADLTEPSGMCRSVRVEIGSYTDSRNYCFSGTDSQFNIQRDPECDSNSVSNSVSDSVSDSLSNSASDSDSDSK